MKRFKEKQIVKQELIKPEDLEFGGSDEEIIEADILTSADYGDIEEFYNGELGDLATIKKEIKAEEAKEAEIIRQIQEYELSSDEDRTITASKYQELKKMIVGLQKKVNILESKLNEERERHFEAMKAMESFYLNASKQTAQIIQPPKS